MMERGGDLPKQCAQKARPRQTLGHLDGTRHQERLHGPQHRGHGARRDLAEGAAEGVGERGLAALQTARAAGDGVTLDHHHDLVEGGGEGGEGASGLGVG